MSNETKITISVPVFESLHYMAALNEIIEKEKDPEICSSLLAMHSRFQKSVSEIDDEEMEKLLRKYSK